MPVLSTAKMSTAVSPAFIKCSAFDNKVWATYPYIVFEFPVLYVQGEIGSNDNFQEQYESNLYPFSNYREINLGKKILRISADFFNVAYGKKDSLLTVTSIYEKSDSGWKKADVFISKDKIRGVIQFYETESKLKLTCELSTLSYAANPKDKNRKPARINKSK